MSSPAPAQATQVTKTELPQWVSDASQSNYNLATDIAGRPLQQYQGPTVAGTSPLTQQAYDAIGKSAGSTDPLFNQAAGLYGQSAATTSSASPLFSSAADYLKQAGVVGNQAIGKFDDAGTTYGQAKDAYGAAGNTYGQAADIYNKTAQPLDIDSYLNPYTSEVQDKATTAANLSLTQQLRGVAHEAQQAGAFGGSRAAVESGVTRGEGIRNIGDMVAALRKQGFDTATANAIADRTGQQASAAGLLGVGSGQAGIGAGLTSVGSGQTGVGQGYLGAASNLQGTAGGLNNTGANVVNQGTALANAGAGVTSLAGAKQAANTNDINALLTGGASQQQQNQSQIDAMVSKFNELRDYPIQGLNMRLAALGMSPYGKTETSNKTSTAEVPQTDFATLGLGALKALPALVATSDRRTKTDITKLTNDDIPMYSYRYKGDPKSYPKVVGPMAEDIEKKYPSAIKKVGKYKTVDINNLMDVLS